MYNTVKNPTELKDLILRRLGAPVINIEVTEDQIYDCIGRAMELYREYHWDALNKAYITFKFDELTKLGNYIDLSAYPIFSVTKIVRKRNMMFGTLGGGASLNWFTDFLLTLSGGSTGCQYHGPFGGMGNLGYYVQIQSYQNLIQDQLDPIQDYWYDSNNGVLQVMGEFQKDDMLIIEVFIDTFSDLAPHGSQAGHAIAGKPTDAVSIAATYKDPYKALPKSMIGDRRMNFPDQGVYNVRWLKDYCTALTKQMWGNILAKHQGMMLPGGTTIDGERIINEAIMEIEKLRTELLLLSEPDPILYG